MLCLCTPTKIPNLLHDVMPYGHIYKISLVQGTHKALHGALHKAKTRPNFKTWLHIYHINENLMIKIVQVGGDSRGGGGGVGPVVGVAANDEAFQSLLIRQQAQEQTMEQNQQATLGVIAE